VFKRAWRMGYYGLGVVIAVAWDTQLSPGDVAALAGDAFAACPNVCCIGFPLATLMVIGQSAICGPT
jgi:hypothetical protein